jgi:hypothetical protein
MARGSFKRRHHRPQSHKPQWLGDVLCIFLLMAICLPIGLWRYRWGMDFTDEGVLAYGAERVMEGQVPHRDFITLQPPLGFYMDAATYKLLGTSVASLRILGLGIYLGVILLIYAIARQLTGRILSAAAALPAFMLGISCFFFVPYSVWQGITASLAAVFLFLRSCSDGPSDRRRCWLAISAGLLTAASILFRHDQGAYSAIAILGYVVALSWVGRTGGSKPNLKPILVFWLGGIVLVFVPFLIYWLAVGAVSEMFRQLVVFPLTTYAKTSSLEFPRFASDQSFSVNAAVCLYYLPPIVELPAAVWLVVRVVRKRFSAKEAKIAFITLWSVLFYCQVLTRSDKTHLLITLPPFLILCAWCWSLVLDGLANAATRHPRFLPRPFWLKTLASACAAALLVAYLLAIKPEFFGVPKNPLEECPIPRVGVQLKPSDAGCLKAIVQAVHHLAPPDRSILSLPYDPMFYFVCQRRNPTRWNYLWAGDQTLEDHLTLIRQAKADPPAVVIIEDDLDMDTFAPVILDYVHQEYKHSWRAGLWTLYWP